MDEKRALNILIANVCCTSSKIRCDKCPFDGTKDCEEIVFDDVLEEAANIVLEGRKSA